MAAETTASHSAAKAVSSGTGCKISRRRQDSSATSAAAKPKPSTTTAALTRRHASGPGMRSIE